MDLLALPVKGFPNLCTCGLQLAPESTVHSEPCDCLQDSVHSPGICLDTLAAAFCKPTISALVGSSSHLQSTVHSQACDYMQDSMQSPGFSLSMSAASPCKPTRCAFCFPPNTAHVFRGIPLVQARYCYAQLQQLTEVQLLSSSSDLQSTGADQMATEADNEAH